MTEGYLEVFREFVETRIKELSEKKKNPPRLLLFQKALELIKQGKEVVYCKVAYKMFFTERINERRKEIEEMGNMVSFPNCRTDLDYPFHMADSASETESSNAFASESERIQKLLCALDYAEICIEANDGTFGKCTSCKNEIPLERLEYDPGAHLCAICQTKLEDKEKKMKNGHTINLPRKR